MSPAYVSSLSYVDNKDLKRTGVPWHGLGVSYDDWLTDSQAKQAVGWDVHLEPQYRRNREGLFVEVEKSNALVRTDTDTPLGNVGDYYVPYQNHELIELGSILVDDWGAKWDTVGSLRDDRIVFATLRLDVASEEGRGLAELGDSEYNSWLLLANAHDGSRSVTGQVVNTRVVCSNTFQAAEAGKKAGWAVRHTGDITAKAIEAQRTIGLVTQHQADFAALQHRLAEAAITEGEFDKVTEELFPITSTTTDRAKDAAECRRKAVRANWLRSDTISESIRPTRWGALNGITEWSEHLADHRTDKRTHSAERRLLSNLFGGGEEKLRQHATAILSRGL